jgi:hypothetical protein
MMIPGANNTLRQQHQQPVSHQYTNAINREIHCEIKRRERQNQNNRQNIFFMFEH